VYIDLLMANHAHNVYAQGYIHWHIRNNGNRKSSSLAFSRDGRTPSGSRRAGRRTPISPKVHWSSLNMQEQ